MKRKLIIFEVLFCFLVVVNDSTSLFGQDEYFITKKINNKTEYTFRGGFGMLTNNYTKFDKVAAESGLKLPPVNNNFAVLSFCVDYGFILPNIISGFGVNLYYPAKKNLGDSLRLEMVHPPEYFFKIGYSIIPFNNLRVLLHTRLSLTDSYLNLIRNQTASVQASDLTDPAIRNNIQFIDGSFLYTASITLDYKFVLNTIIIENKKNKRTSTNSINLSLTAEYINSSGSWNQNDSKVFDLPEYSKRGWFVGLSISYSFNSEFEYWFGY